MVNHAFVSVAPYGLLGLAGVMYLHLYMPSSLPVQFGWQLDSLFLIPADSAIFSLIFMVFVCFFSGVTMSAQLQYVYS